MRFGPIVIDQIEYLYAIIVLAVLLIVILRKKYVKEEQRLFKGKGKKVVMFFTKLTFFSALLLAIVNPYIEYKENFSNVSKIKVLFDDSDSMMLYDHTEFENSLSQVSGVSIAIDKLNLGDYSSIGSGLLNNLAPNENILLVSDGQNNFGANLEDVALFASSINSRIYSIKLQEKNEDSGIVIEGPSKVVSGVENVYTIKVNEIGSTGRKDVTVYVDDELKFNGKYSEKIEFKHSFASGNHIIKAVLETGEDDLFKENNEYFKTVYVYNKPKVLFYSTKGSPLEKLYSPFYSVELVDDLDVELSDYYAVVLNNVNAKELSDDDIESLEDYAVDGNGLFVIGGKNSYDWGDYNRSLLTNMLPVSIGKAKKKKDITNIFILMDTGAGAFNVTKDEIGGIQYIDVQKSIAVDIIKSVSSTNRLGIIEANYYLNTLSGLSELGPKRAQLIALISLLRTQGISEFQFAYKKAHEILRLNKGSKNIVLITDGDILPYEKPLLKKYVEKAHNDGVKTFIISTGKVADESFLQSIKELGGGEYFTVDETQRIKIYFGNPGEIPPDDMKLFTYDSNHFITKGLKELGKVYGFNNVYPKSTARLLITTTSGEPVLTIWNYGVGRIASLSTDDGSTWVPDLLQEENSKLLIRTLNWAIGNPERKNNVILEIPNLRLGENSVITLKSDAFPHSDQISFYEVDNGLYKGNYFPEDTGITKVMGLPVGVNYKKEYLNLGLNEDLEKILSISGGEILENDENLVEKLKSISIVKTTKRYNLGWVFILVAIIIYLLEIFIRRLYELKQQ